MARHNYDPFQGLKGEPLTEGELKALWLYSRNDTPAKIAERLDSTPSTITTWLKLARLKSGSHTSWQAHEKAERLGLYKLLSEAINPKFRVVFPPRPDLHS